jgi:hypothetical protein
MDSLAEEIVLDDGIVLDVLVIEEEAPLHVFGNDLVTACTDPIASDNAPHTFPDLPEHLTL